MVQIGLGLCFSVFFPWVFEPALFLALQLFFNFFFYIFFKFWFGVLTFGLTICLPDCLFYAFSPSPAPSTGD